MSQGVKGLSHIYSNNSATDVVVVTMLDCFDDVYQAFLGKTRVVEAFLGTATYPVNYFIESKLIGRQFFSCVISPFFGISLIEALKKFAVSSFLLKQWRQYLCKADLK
jgi:hypothetical protein